MRIKTAALTDAALDWAVAKCQPELHVGVYHKRTFLDWFKSFGYLSPHGTDTTAWAPSNDWSQGGPIIEREKIGTWPSESISGKWGARMLNTYIMYGPTPLIAAMRCFVASKLGDEVEVPDELA
jgi:hypothetical protein